MAGPQTPAESVNANPRYQRVQLITVQLGEDVATSVRGHLNPSEHLPAVTFLARAYIDGVNFDVPCIAGDQVYCLSVTVNGKRGQCESQHQ